MKKFRFKFGTKNLAYGLRVAFSTVIIIILSPYIWAADPPRPTDKNQTEKQIEITADQFKTDNQENYMDFTGDVRASQGNLVITSERLRIYYKANPDSSNSQTGSQQSIEQIVASGDVKISSDKYQAAADRVEYDLDSTVLVLKGEDSTIQSDENLITGSVITINRSTGQIKVDRGPGKRVKALFYSKENNPDDPAKTE